MSRTAGRPKPYRGRRQLADGDDALGEVHAMRLGMIRNDSWPRWCDDEWHRLAADARRKRAQSIELTVSDRRAIETSDALNKRDGKVGHRQKRAA